MATLYPQQDKNIAKTWVIMTTFFAAVILLGWGEGGEDVGWYATLSKSLDFLIK